MKTNDKTTLEKARDYARRRFNKHEAENWHQPSHSAAMALEETETKFPKLGTFGVEGDCSDNGEGHVTIQYLNTGDTYEKTVIYWRGRFCVSSVGDILELAD